MKILLKKILEKLTIIIFFLVIIVGNVFFVYNIVNKYIDIEKRVDIQSIIQSSKYIEITKIETNQKVEIISDEEKLNLIKRFNGIKVRDGKINFLDRNQCYEYIIYILDEKGNENIIDIGNRQLIVYDKLYTSDFKLENAFDNYFEN